MNPATTTLAALSAVIALLSVYLFGKWQQEKGRALGIAEGWQTGYFFKQNENKARRTKDGKFKTLA